MDALAALPDTPAVDDAFIDALVARVGRGPEALLPILQALQAEYRYLSPAALRRVCELTDITPAALIGVATFYSQFRHRPVGRHLISLCCGTACHVKGADGVLAALRRHLRLTGEADTDATGAFTIQRVACLGCCTLAPVLQIDGVTYGHLTPRAVPRVLADFLELEQRGAVARACEPLVATGPGLAEIRIGVGSCCLAGGSGQVREALERAVRDGGVPVAVKPVGCVGMCHQTPLIEVAPPGGPSTLYARVQADDAPAIVRRHFGARNPLRRMYDGLTTALDHLLTDEAWTPITRYALDTREAPVCHFLGPQRHIATEHGGSLAPLALDDYLTREGFTALRAALTTMTPDEVIAEITTAGLRGRGGAGYPTGHKWAAVRAAEGEPKYLICNGDEGDPGAFMDRMLLESYPYRILEGMAIGAYAVGAREGILYIRAEYPLAVRRLREAIAHCERRGYLGAAVLGTPFDLRLRVVEGAGAYVCGEETALIASVEGRRGMPRLRPPYPAISGLWGQPTLVNNVETFANVPWIVRHGAVAFAAIGENDSRGTKVFALAGKVARGGLIEVPMGIAIRRVIEEIGGGIAGGGALKAVQIGGPSGGCIPAALCDTPIDYEALRDLGAIMGSGGLVAMDEGDCMVDLARYFLRFTQEQSCGKCTLCRIGTRRMLEILDRLCAGTATPEELPKLEELAGAVSRGSLCGLGQSAPNPVLSTLRYYRDEYEAHLRGRCPAGQCKALIHYRVTERCIGCTKCAQRCPVNAIPLTPYRRHVIDDARCTRCDTCRVTCPTGAIVVE